MRTAEGVVGGGALHVEALDAVAAARCLRPAQLRGRHGVVQLVPCCADAKVEAGTPPRLPQPQQQPQVGEVPWKFVAEGEAAQGSSEDLRRWEAALGLRAAHEAGVKDGPASIKSRQARRRILKE